MSPFCFNFLWTDFFIGKFFFPLGKLETSHKLSPSVYHLSQASRAFFWTENQSQIQKAVQSFAKRIYTKWILILQTSSLNKSNFFFPFKCSTKALNNFFYQESFIQKVGNKIGNPPRIPQDCCSAFPEERLNKLMQKCNKLKIQVRLVGFPQIILNCFLITHQVLQREH